MQKGTESPRKVMTHAHAPHEEAEHAEHNGASGYTKRLALLIAVLALFLAVTETLGKSAQTHGLSSNIEAANLWAFFQARTARQTTLKAAAEQTTLLMPGLEATSRTAAEKQIAAWNATIARWESEPATGEGRKELTARAQHAEAERDHAMAAYHAFEYASAAFQVAIVVASASIITGVPLLAFGAAVLGGIGLVLAGIGYIDPGLLHAAHAAAPH
jgi:heme-degrading monooxygenase HmoA